MTGHIDPEQSQIAEKKARPKDLGHHVMDGKSAVA